MDNLRIDTGIKKILINDGPEFIEFNPSDVIFAEKFYKLTKELEVKRVEYQQRADILDANKELDIMGLPVNIPENIALTKEACAFIREKIDELFGAGISQKLFGNTQSLDVFSQFFSGITPYIQSARTEKITQYTPPPGTVKRKRHKVME